MKRGRELAKRSEAIQAKSALHKKDFAGKILVLLASPPPSPHHSLRLTPAAFCVGDKVFVVTTDTMQEALRNCRASCNGHIKELEKKAQLSKKAENGERNEIQKLIAQLFAD